MLLAYVWVNAYKKCRNNLRVCFTSQFVSQLFKHFAYTRLCEFASVRECMCACGATHHSMLGRERNYAGCGGVAPQ